MTKKQKEKNKKVEALSQDVETRWNSMFQMLKRVLNNKERKEMKRNERVNETKPFNWVIKRRSENI